jgi:hypothetical protein
MDSHLGAADGGTDDPEGEPQKIRLLIDFRALEKLLASELYKARSDRDHPEISRLSDTGPSRQESRVHFGKRQIRYGKPSVFARFSEAPKLLCEKDHGFQESSLVSQSFV